MAPLHFSTILTEGRLFRCIRKPPYLTFPRSFLFLTYISSSDKSVLAGLPTADIPMTSRRFLWITEGRTLRYTLPSYRGFFLGKSPFVFLMEDSVGSLLDLTCPIRSFTMGPFLSLLARLFQRAFLSAFFSCRQERSSLLAESVGDLNEPTTLPVLLRISLPDFHVATSFRTLMLRHARSPPTGAIHFGHGRPGSPCPNQTHPPPPPHHHPRVSCQKGPSRNFEAFVFLRP